MTDIEKDLNTCNVNFKKVHPKAKMPTYGTNGAGGFDFYCPEYYEFLPNESKYVDLGIAMEIPKGYSMLLLARSSTSTKTAFRLINGVHLVDSDYRGTIKAYMRNTCDHEIKIIDPGQRLLQGVLIKNHKVKFKEVENLSETERGTGGYGSTGK